MLILCLILQTRALRQYAPRVIVEHSDFTSVAAKMYFAACVLVRVCACAASGHVLLSLCMEDVIGMTCRRSTERSMRRAYIRIHREKYISFALPCWVRVICLDVLLQCLELELRSDYHFSVCIAWRGNRISTVSRSWAMVSWSWMAVTKMVLLYYT